MHRVAYPLLYQAQITFQADAQCFLLIPLFYLSWHHASHAIHDDTPAVKKQIQPFAKGAIPQIDQNQAL
jgi:hypothetical protein